MILFLGVGDFVERVRKSYNVEKLKRYEHVKKLCIKTNERKAGLLFGARIV